MLKQIFQKSSKLARFFLHSFIAKINYFFLVLLLTDQAW